MGIQTAQGVQFKTNVPVIIIGAGACGLCAALRATERGARVKVLERDSRPRGATALSGGEIAAAGTRLQREQGILDTPEQFAADITAWTDNTVDSEIALAIAEASGPTVDWLVDQHGIKFQLESVSYAGHSVQRLHALKSETLGPSGVELQLSLLRSATKKKIDIETSASVVNLFVDRRARIRGVEVERTNGRRRKIGCEAIVFACGGFEGSQKMVDHYIPEMAGSVNFGHPGNSGDALRWSLALGATLGDLANYQGQGTVAYPQRISLWMLSPLGGAFQVNQQGQRFSNETRGYSEQAADVLRQPGGTVWSIHDAHGHEILLDFVRYREARKRRAVRSAASVEDLARITNLPRRALAQTVRDVREMIANTKNDTFGRDFSCWPPLRRPYYAVRVTGALFHTQGGAIVNKRARVVQKNGARFPNLFAGGGAARGLSGQSPSGYLSGNGLLMATTLGRLAGEGAAKLVKRHKRPLDR